MTAIDSLSSITPNNARHSRCSLSVFSLVPYTNPLYSNN